MLAVSSGKKGKSYNSMDKIRIGIVGCGTIGSAMAQLFRET